MSLLKSLDIKKTLVKNASVLFLVIKECVFLAQFRLFYSLFTLNEVKSRIWLKFSLYTKDYQSFDIYDCKTILSLPGPWFSQEDTKESDSVRLNPLFRYSSYLSCAIRRRISWNERFSIPNLSSKRDKYLLILLKI